MTGYLTGSVTVPNYGQNVNILYAPTMKGQYNGCLEFGSDYEYSNGSYKSFFYGVDWCNNGVGVKFPMDQNFINAYVRVYSTGDGNPEYQGEAKLEGDNRCHLLIANVATAQYNDIAQTVGSTPTNSFGGEGWAIWESHYFNVGGLCPKQSQIMAIAGIRFRSSGSSWSYPQPWYNQILKNNNNPSGGTDCFTGSNYISINPRSPDLGWYTQYH